MLLEVTLDTYRVAQLSVELLVGPGVWSSPESGAWVENTKREPGWSDLLFFFF